MNWALQLSLAAQILLLTLGFYAVQLSPNRTALKYIRIAAHICGLCIVGFMFWGINLP